MKFKFQRQIEKGKRQRERQREQKFAKTKSQPETATIVVVQVVEVPKPKSAAKMRREARLAHERKRSGCKGSSAHGPRNGVQHGVVDPFVCNESVLQRAGLDELEFEADMAEMLESMFSSRADEAA